MKTKKKKHPIKRSVSCICRDCGDRTEQQKKEFAKASIPRCMVCGGALRRARDI